MKKLIALTTVAVMSVAFTAAPAAAKKMKHRHAHASQSMGGSGMAPSQTGGNAALSGNNGNSGQGDNSLGHIKGGNLGGDR